MYNNKNKSTLICMKMNLTKKLLIKESTYSTLSSLANLSPQPS
ncbi:MAG: hypothetical protein ACI81S_001189 [Sphingobacteriales bacterium]|jgi:hypothetical protein